MKKIAAITVFFIILLFCGNCKAKYLQPEKNCNNWTAPENMGAQINTASNEYNPIVIADLLVFSSDRPGGAGGLDIWSAQYSCGMNCNWAWVVNFGSSVNSPSNERGPLPVITATPSFPLAEPTFTTMYFCSDKPGGKGGFDIYVQAGGSTQTPQDVGATINSAFDDMYFWTSPEESSAFFCSNRPGGYGGYDIWAVSKTAGTWNLPYNAGPEINSSSNEECPFLSPDLKQIFFVSDRPNGSGGKDIWTSYWTGAAWNNPINICEINSADNEYRPSFSVTGYYKKLIFSSDRPGGYGGYDLYAAKNVQ